MSVTSADLAAAPEQLTPPSESRAGRLRQPRFTRTYAQRSATFDTPARRLLLVAIVACLVFAPRLVSPQTLLIYIMILMAMPGAVALNALQGIAGQVSAGNAAFMCIGAVAAAAVLQVDPGVPFLLNLLVGGAAAGLVGAAIGLPAVRIRGLYLLIATVALHFITLYLGDLYQSHVVGDAGFTYPEPKMFGLVISGVTDWYYLLLIAAAASIWIFKNWLASRVGRSWVAVRDSEEASAILGVNVARTKIGVFIATSAVIGVQGVLFAYFTQIIQVDNFTFDLAIQYIAIVIIGGQASVLGTVLGAIFVEAMPYVLQDWATRLPAGFPGASLINNQIFDVQNLVYGLLIIVFLLWAPGGLVELWERARRRLRAWPFKRDLVVRKVLE